MYLNSAKSIYFFLLLEKFGKWVYIQDTFISIQVEPCLLLLKKKKEKKP